MADPRKKIPYGLFVGIATAIIFVLTFPWREPDYGVGLDNSWRWAINWLFSNNYQYLTQLSYPLGPLGLLIGSATVGHNVLVALVFYCAIKLSFILAALRLGRLYGHKLIYCSLFVYLACTATRPDICLIAITLALCLLWLKEGYWPWWVAAAIVASIGFCIKVSLGVETISVIFLSWLVSCRRQRQLRYTLLSAFLALGIFFLMCLCVFQCVTFLWNYLVSAIQLTVGYGGALTLEFHNRWWLLAIAAAAFILLIIFDGEIGGSRLLLFISLGVLFSVWKHAIVREDASHYMQLFFFVIVFFGLLFLITRRYWPSIALGLVCTLAVGLNFTWNNPQGREFLVTRLAICNVDRFAETCLHFRRYEDHYSELSHQHLTTAHLDENTLELIGEQTIDFFPWEHSYAAANPVRWQPRLTLGSAMSVDLSALAAANYGLDSGAAECVLWHIGESPDCTYDGRYFLNDEPMAVFNLLSNYNVVVRQENFVLLHRNPQPAIAITRQESPFQVELGNWIAVPQDSTSITRLLVNARKTFWGNVRSIFYKDAIHYVDYHFTDGSTRTYRYLLSTASEGLWVNPFLLSPLDEGCLIVDSVRLRATPARALNSKLTLQWQTLSR